MTMQIGSNIKRLRTSRGMTQEELADFIGVSFQAVSKWEREEGLPDITLLPVLARFFDISLDELVGMDAITNQEGRDAIDAQRRKLSSQGKVAEAIAVLREGLKCFPHDYAWMAELATLLDGHGKTEEERRKNTEESIALSERILNFCTDAAIRGNVQANVCYSLRRAGEHKRGKEIAQSLPNFYKTSQTVLPWFLEGEELLEYTQQTVQMLTYCVRSSIHHMRRSGQYSPEEELALLEKMEALYRLVYEKEDYGFAHIRLGDTCEDMAVLHFDAGRVDEGFACLTRAAEHYAAYDSLPEEYLYTSLMVNRLTYRREETSTNTTANCCRRSLDWIRRVKTFSPYLEDARMQAVFARLEEYAN